MTVSALLWAENEDLTALGYSDEDAVDGIRNASWVLWALSGRRFHNIGTREELYRYTRGGRHDLYLLGPDPDVREFTYRPMWSDEETEVDEDRFEVVGSILYLRSGFASNTILRLMYDVGSNLPPMSKRACVALAEQYTLAKCGDKKCKLPERITSVTRDGVSWAVLDPQDFLERGLTGIGEIDSWLRTVNPLHTRQRPRLFDAAQPRKLRGAWVDEETSA